MVPSQNSKIVGTNIEQRHADAPLCHSFTGTPKLQTSTYSEGTKVPRVPHSHIIHIVYTFPQALKAVGNSLRNTAWITYVVKVIKCLRIYDLPF